MEKPVPYNSTSIKPEPNNWIFWLGSFVVSLPVYVTAHLLSNYRGAVFNVYSLCFRDMSASFLGTSMDHLNVRFLVPLMGWLVGLRGENFYYMSPIGIFLFLSLVTAWGWRHYRSLSSALLVSLILGTLIPVQFHFAIPGWADIYCYCFFLAALLLPRWSALMVLLGLACHEFFIMYIPIIYLHHILFEHKRLFPHWRDYFYQAVLLVTALILYIHLRDAILIYHDTPPGRPFRLTWEGILQNVRKQPVWVGALFTFKFLWIFFILAVWRILRGFPSKPVRSFLEFCLMISAPLAAFLFLLYAWDTNRFLAHGFFFVMLLPLYFTRRRQLLAACFILNLLVPSFYVGWNWHVPLTLYAKPFDKSVGKYLYANGRNYHPVWKSDWHEQCLKNAEEEIRLKKERETRAAQLSQPKP